MRFGQLYLKIQQKTLHLYTEEEKNVDKEESE